MKVLIDIPKESYDFAKECKHNGTSKYNWCLSHNDVVFMIANGTPIPDNATIGDTVKAMFPNIDFGTLAQDDVIVNKDYSNNGELQVFIPIKVWTAPYKRGDSDVSN